MGTKVGRICAIFKTNTTKKTKNKTKKKHDGSATPFYTLHVDVGVSTKWNLFSVMVIIKVKNMVRKNRKSGMYFFFNCIFQLRSLCFSWFRLIIKVIIYNYYTNNYYALQVPAAK